MLFDHLLLDGGPELLERAFGEAAEFGEEGVVVLRGVSGVLAPPVRWVSGSGGERTLSGPMEDTNAAARRRVSLLS